MYDYTLKFESEVEMVSTLGEVLGGNCNHNHNVDIIGTIYKDDAVTLPGHHVNVRSAVRLDFRDEHLCYPKTPERVWA
ncbi:MAG: hypothetical protein ACRCYB_12260 [Aeromonas veronii]